MVNQLNYFSLKIIHNNKNLFLFSNIYSLLYFNYTTFLPSNLNLALVLVSLLHLHLSSFPINNIFMRSKVLDFLFCYFLKILGVFNLAVVSSILDYLGFVFILCFKRSREFLIVVYNILWSFLDQSKMFKKLENFLCFNAKGLIFEHISINFANYANDQLIFKYMNSFLIPTHDCSCLTVFQKPSNYLVFIILSICIQIQDVT